MQLINEHMPRNVKASTENQWYNNLLFLLDYGPER